MIALAVLLTQIAASHPHREPWLVRVSPGVWVVSLGRLSDDEPEQVFVMDDQLRSLAQTAALRSCLGQHTDPHFELAHLVGGRGVVVASGDRACLVRANDVVPVAKAGLRFDWREYVVHDDWPPGEASQGMRRRLLAADFTRLVADAGTCTVPGTRLEVTLRREGLTVLRQGRVDEALTASLRSQVALGDDLSHVSLTVLPIGLSVRRETDDCYGTCPACDDFDDSTLIRWTGAGLDAQRLPARPGPYDLRSSSTTHRSDLSFAHPLDAGAASLPLPGSSWVLDPNEMSVKLDGGVEPRQTERLRALIRQRCVDRPEFVIDGELLASEAENQGGRCSGEIIIGCTITVGYDAAHRQLEAWGEPAEVVSCVREAAAADAGFGGCRERFAGSALIEYAYARELGRQGQLERMKLHLELSLAAGLGGSDADWARAALKSPR